MFGVSLFKRGFGGFTVPWFMGEKYYDKDYLDNPREVLPNSENFPQVVKRIGQFIYELETKYSSLFSFASFIIFSISVYGISLNSSKK